MTADRLEARIARARPRYIARVAAVLVDAGVPEAEAERLAEESFARLIAGAVDAAALEILEREGLA